MTLDARELAAVAVEPLGEVEQFFIDAARDCLTKGQFNLIMNAAVEKWKTSDQRDSETKPNE